MRAAIRKEFRVDIRNTVERIEKTFGQDGLDYAIAQVIDPSASLLSAVMRDAGNVEKYSLQQCKYLKIIVYFLAPIGSEEGKKYVTCCTGRCFVKENIVDPVSCLSQWQKFFFFDGYRSHESLDSEGRVMTSVDIEAMETSTDSPAWRPKQGDTLVAYSPFACVKREDHTHPPIATWTNTLCDNIDSFILPISTLLDKTWDEVALSTSTVHEPHYVSSMGMTFLQGGILIVFD